ncbi:MAG: DNA polymerase III subunit epsilon [Gammaproteobacteria bacterium]|jgi:DNA polymerase III subunit epsilon|nr:DNA polymerase III subunit epsilon [Gammaproteobacteria bacterium]MBT7603246.1 DNA polymerase III subunit epsilon [Gammaproteobacteria bacterium]
MSRQIILDTETTGLDVTRNHKIIEVGCVELIDRKYTGKKFHKYLNPLREIDQGAISIHGITNEFLKDKPIFKDIKDELLNFINGSELIIHNAPFDVGFLELEFKNSSQKIKLDLICKIFDTLVYARRLHPGQKNSLDALCKRYDIDNSSREFHGALLDARILGDVYLAMTGGQTSFNLIKDKVIKKEIASENKVNAKYIVKKANEDELRAHNTLCAVINDASDNRCIWNIFKF